MGTKRPTVDKWIKKKCGMCKQWNTNQCWKRRLFCDSDSVDKLGDNYIKWNQLHTEREILCDLTKRWNLNQKKELMGIKRVKVARGQAVEEQCNGNLVKGLKSFRWIKGICFEIYCMAEWLQSVIMYISIVLRQYISNIIQIIEKRGNR